MEGIRVDLSGSSKTKRQSWTTGRLMQSKCMCVPHVYNTCINNIICARVCVCVCEFFIPFSSAESSNQFWPNVYNGHDRGMKGQDTSLFVMSIARLHHSPGTFETSVTLSRTRVCVLFEFNSNQLFRFPRNPIIARAHWQTIYYIMSKRCRI